MLWKILTAKQARSSALLGHSPYLKTLPPPEKLSTSLHFSPIEIEAFRGTNLYGATFDRERMWRDEWDQCRSTVIAVDAAWGSEFTWSGFPDTSWTIFLTFCLGKTRERYLTASTYLSSRAFPSTLLSLSPSLEVTLSSYPILLPGIDSLNHARAHPVSWLVSYPDINEHFTLHTNTKPNISLVIHSSASPGQELFNNYGDKPNSELILGYGFSLPQNPADTIVLKIGGQKEQGQKWEVGRNASGADGLWEELLGIVALEVESESRFESELEAAGALADMTQMLLDRLPGDTNVTSHMEVRPEVALMVEHYLQGAGSPIAL
jgi:hypothetical protein